MNATTTILLVGHGSRGREGNTETINFAAQWRERHPEWRIEVCFIEHADVLLNDGLDRAARDARQVLVIPFILNAAGHVKMELPAAIETARERHPNVDFVVTRHLGINRENFIGVKRDVAPVLCRQFNLRTRPRQQHLTFIDRIAHLQRAQVAFFILGESLALNGGNAGDGGIGSHAGTSRRKN